MISCRRAPLAAAILALVLRLPFFAWPLISDEGNYAYTVYWWARGAPLYVNLLGLEKPQGLFLTYLIPVQLLGGSTWAIRFWGALWIAATVVVVYTLARRMYAPQGAAVAAFLYALYSTLPVIEGFSANAETFMVLPLALSALAVLDGRWFIAGVAAGAALSFKPSGIAALLLLAVCLARQRPGYRALCHATLGTLLPLAALLLHGAWSAGWRSYLDNIILFRFGGGYQPYGSPILAARIRWEETLPAWLPLVLLLPLAFRHSPRQRVFLAVWIAATIVGMSLGGHWNWHYWIQLMPPLCLAAAPALVLLAQRRRLLERLVTLALFALPLLTIALYALRSPQAGSYRLYHRTGYQIAADVASYVRSHSSESDTLYIAFAEADIYYLSRRKAAVPFLSYVQMVDYPGAYDEIVASVASRTPTYVLALDPPITSLDPTGRFDAALQANYLPERTFGPATLYRRRTLP